MVTSPVIKCTPLLIVDSQTHCHRLQMALACTHSRPYVHAQAPLAPLLDLGIRGYSPRCFGKSSECFALLATPLAGQQETGKEARSGIYPSKTMSGRQARLEARRSGTLRGQGQVHMLRHRCLTYFALNVDLQGGC